MKRFVLYLSFSIVLLSVTSCTRWWAVSPDFESVSQSHKTLAVLPYQMVLLGRQPERLTDEQLLEIEEAEGHAFQISMHDQMLRSLKNGRFTLDVRLMGVEETNSRLNEAGFTYNDLYSVPPSDIAKAIGVDAVYTARIEKYRLLTDLESFGIDLAQTLVALFSDGLLLPFVNTTAQDVYIRAGIIDATHGQQLFLAERSFGVDWTNPSAQIIRNINYQIAKRIPYRSRE